MINNKNWILIAGIFGLTGVAFGAFGAHIISNKIPENLYEAYKTGILYHLIHSIIIAVIGFSSYKEFNISGLLFTCGIMLFSFSLYIYALTGNSTFAMITPIGGVSFLAGWILLIWKAITI